MRKTIIPAAIVLAAPAVTMQAQAATLTPDAVQKEISAVSTEIGTYPKAVQDMFSSELSQLENDLRKVRDNAEMIDEQKAIEYATIIANAQDVQKRAKEEETKYQTAKKDAVDAWDAARTAYTTAYNNINSLSVPSVKTEYLNKLTTDYPQPANYTDDDLKALYESIGESEKIESARNEYTANVEQLVEDAQKADSEEQAEQPKRKTALENSITAVKNNVQPTYNDVYSYVDYGKDVDLKKISGVTAALEGIKNDVATSRTNWELTAEKAAEYEQKITAQASTLTTTAGDALAAAKAKAEEDAAKLVSGLTEYTVFGPDDYTTAAKEAANVAIQEAITAAENLAKLYVQTDYEAQAKVVPTKVDEATTAIKAVTSYENNYKAYSALKTTYENLKAAYETAAIKLSTLKANNGIDAQFYNEANSQLNVVAQMLETFAQTNQTKYEKDKAYSDGVDGTVYGEVKAMLDADYDTEEEIADIVEKAVGYNTTLAKLTGYQTQVGGINATVSHDNVNYPEAVNTLNGELGAKKTALADELAGLVTVYRTNKTLGKTTAEIEQAISVLKTAIATAQDDLDAYVSSKEQVATWTATVDAILKKIPNPVSQDYDAHKDLEDDRTQATDYESKISQLDTDADDAFNDSPRRSQKVWSGIQNGTDYTNLLSDLSNNNVGPHLKAYQEWLDEQGDVAAYKLGLKYCEELKALLKAAEEAAPGALGFGADQDNIGILETEVKNTHTPGHKFNDCIAAMESWKKTYDSIKQSIADHMKAWQDNQEAYDDMLATLTGILDFEAEAPQLDLYTKLNGTNKAEILKAIKDARTALDEANKKQEASLFDAAEKQTEILDMIAQLKLQEELDASGIATAIAAVRNTLDTKEGWNPKEVFSNKLQTYSDEYDNFTDGLKYFDYVTKNDYVTKHNRIQTLKSDIEAVATAAKENFDTYTNQLNAQEEAKAAWAKIYSSVGATYGDQFPGAQEYYQRRLNECFKVLTGYDAKILKQYNEGRSVEFSTDEYNNKIAENLETMQSIEKAAKANKLAYDEQMVKWDALVSCYNGEVSALEDKIETIKVDIDGASVDVKEILEKQKTDWVYAMTELTTSVKPAIDGLKTGIEKAVNEGGSADYTYDDRTISSDINRIISTAEGTYNANVAKHNEVVLRLFIDAYDAAKADYNKYALQIDAYAGYKHALDDNGVSAYDTAIKEAQADIFALNTQLVSKYSEATDSIAKATTYVDKEQNFKKEVLVLHSKLKDAYDKFRETTQGIANTNEYAKPLTELAKAYTKAKTAIERYEFVDVKSYLTFDGTALETAYNEASKENVNNGPQMLDELRTQAERQMGQVTTAWNKAAYDEASHAWEDLSDLHVEYKNLDYPIGYTAWSYALESAIEAIHVAETAIKETKDHEGFDRIKSDITTAKTNLENAKKTADADEDCTKAKETRGKNQATINGFSLQIDNVYKKHDYRSELEGLIIEAETAVSKAYEANTAAYHALYRENSAEYSALTTAIDAVKAALEDLKAEADRLVLANQPAGIVKTLLDKAKELVPLYNRAEANAKTKGDSEAIAACEGLYKDLTKLLNELGTEDAETIKNIADAKDSYNTQIDSLRTRIIEADVEQRAYNELLKSLEKVQGEFGNVQEYIKASAFASKLKDAFSERVSDLQNQLLAAQTQINIDHANNRCDKDNAGFKAGDFDAISGKISNLDKDVKDMEKALQKAQADAETREANVSAYNKASSAISELDKYFVIQWEDAQKQYVDVYALYADTEVKDLQDAIAKLQTSLKVAFDAAQVDPIILDTDDYATASYYVRISELMNKIRERQAQFEADVTNLNGQIAELKEAFEAIEISDVAAANEDVKKEKAAIETAIAAIEKKMSTFYPTETDGVQSDINAANELILKFKETVARKTYVPGDITGTGAVDVNDTFMILQLILEKSTGDTLGENAKKAADMDGDGAFTVADLVQITNLYVYGTKTGPQGSNRVAAAADAEVGSIDMQLDTDRMNVLLDSTTGYSAIQMDVEMPQGVSINEVNFAGDSQKVMVATNTLENGVQRIVIYSTDGSSILNGENSLINLGLAGEGMGIVSIDNIIASTAVGQRHNLMGVTGAYTIVTGIEATETAEGNTSVFDINGMVRKTVQKGVNIVKDAAGKVKKMLMK